MYKPIIKPFFDFCASFTAVVLLLPIYLVIYIVLRLSKTKEPLFYQPRPGKNEKVFQIIKFKTMTDEKNSEGELLPDDKRLTRIGLFLRKTSLDEIPQLINVLKGDMSLVGPRPLLKKYNALYSDEQLQRFKVKPGVTGLAQVSGRNSISWKEKFSFDVEYVKNQSLLFDLQILIRTAKIVFLKSGVNQSTEATMEPFNGKN